MPRVIFNQIGRRLARPLVLSLTLTTDLFTLVCLLSLPHVYFFSSWLGRVRVVLYGFQHFMFELIRFMKCVFFQHLYLVRMVTVGDEFITRFVHDFEAYTINIKQLKRIWLRPHNSKKLKFQCGLQASHNNICFHEFRVFRYFLHPQCRFILLYKLCSAIRFQPFPW